MSKYLKMLFVEGNDGSDPAEPKGAEPKGNEGNEPKAGEDEKKYTDKDVNDLIDKKFKEWQKKQQKAVDEAERLAGMTAQEQAEEWQKKYDELLKQNKKANLTSEARKILANAGITNIEDELVNRLVTDDADTTKANVDNFVSLFNKAVQEGIKNANKKKSPKSSNGGITGLTKEEILKEPDAKKRQKLIKENLDKFM